MMRQYEPKQALAYGVAVATANALSPNTGDFDPEVMEQIFDQVKVEAVEKGEEKCH